jgi:elongation factor Ts
VNCETDFVARDQNFLGFANAVADTALAEKATHLDQLNQLTLKDLGITIEEARQALVAKVGENVHIRRMIVVENPPFLGTYLHGSRIGTLVSLEGGDQNIAKDIAMHIAASKPLVVKPEDVPADIIAKEKEIYLAQAASSGKSQDIIDKMVNGRLKKYLDEVSLLGQPFIKEPEITVQSLLNKNRAKVLSFIRYEVGEGIEKEKEDFVEAVRSQIQGGG